MADVVEDVERVRERILADHRGVVERALECADAVAADLPAPVTDGRALADAIERALSEAGVLRELPAVLRTGVDALDASLPADPVAAPPYVVVTSRGPMCRATTDRGRLVILIECFAVRTRGRTRGESRYDETGSDPEAALVVALR